MAAIMIVLPPLYENPKRLPFLFWYPLSIQTSLNTNDAVFGGFYVHQFFVAAFCSSIENGVDTFLFSTLIFLKYQIQILGYRLSQCGLDYDIKTNDPVKNHQKQLIDCVKMHNDIAE